LAQLTRPPHTGALCVRLQRRAQHEVIATQVLDLDACVALDADVETTFKRRCHVQPLRSSAKAEPS
jgi:hypothetical protein